MKKAHLRRHYSSARGAYPPDTIWRFTKIIWNRCVNSVLGNSYYRKSAREAWESITVSCITGSQERRPFSLGADSLSNFFPIQAPQFQNAFYPCLYPYKFISEIYCNKKNHLLASRLGPAWGWQYTGRGHTPRHTRPRPRALAATGGQRPHHHHPPPSRPPPPPSHCASVRTDPKPETKHNLHQSRGGKNLHTVIIYF